MILFYILFGFILVSQKICQKEILSDKMVIISDNPLFDAVNMAI